ncbi:MAG TPA: LptA/OstA family protein, partial [Bryobacteraceae bacterium]|nr:LptA/OstA family protein [Bryobacteraceae bacterium]
SMRRFRRLILAVIFVILAGVGITYKDRLLMQHRNAPAPALSLPDNVSAQANEGWVFTQTDPHVEIRAQAFRQIAEPARFELTGVEIHFFHKDEKTYDQVKSEHAAFSIGDSSLFSDGEVEITMGVAAGEQKAGRLLHIKSSGVRFDSKTGKATTEKAAFFTFDRGEGSATGAEYDPSTRELHMTKDVTLKWNGKTPKDKAMIINAGSVIYKESESKVYLSPWTKFKRDTLSMDAAESTVTLKDGVIQFVDAKTPKGTDRSGSRQIDYSADRMLMHFDDDGAIKIITGEPNAHVIASSETAKTSIQTNRVDMEFDTSTDSSVLRKATATGAAVVESHPVARGNAPLPETRILKSESVVVFMRSGGQEIETVEALTPGSIEFVPNRPGQKHRTLKGDRMWIAYGPQNQIQSFKTINASTRTDPEQVKGKTPQPPSLTWSKNLLAEFQPGSGQLTKLDQSGEFRFEEGARKAYADRATLEQTKDQITLDGLAKVWDPTGSTAGDKIVLNQKSGDFDAIGNVSSTRIPEKKKKDAGAGMLSGDDPLQAKAAHMTSAENNQKVRYEGRALLWQGANRITAERIDIDRKSGLLQATGNVVSELLDRSGDKKVAKKDGKASERKSAAVFTVVRAPELTYSDKDRVAHYTGGVVLNRPGMVVDARELRAFLKDSEGESSLEKTIADGAVKIVQTAKDRRRTGTSEHAEYYVAEEKVFMQGGEPQLVDTLRGTTRGAQLTYFSGNDRLLVDGVEAQPAVSKIHKKS